MRIQLDTTAKTIKVENTVNFGELVDFLEKFLPGEWKTYKLEANTIIQNWGNPIYIDRYRPDPYCWNSPTFVGGFGTLTVVDTSDTTTAILSGSNVAAGTYCVQTN